MEKKKKKKKKDKEKKRKKKRKNYCALPHASFKTPVLIIVLLTEPDFHGLRLFATKDRKSFYTLFEGIWS